MSLLLAGIQTEATRNPTSLSSLLSLLHFLPCLSFLAHIFSYFPPQPQPPPTIAFWDLLEESSSVVISWPLDLFYTLSLIAIILSYPILSYPILSYPILSYSILSYSYHALPSPSLDFSSTHLCKWWEELYYWLDVKALVVEDNEVKSSEVKERVILLTWC